MAASNENDAKGGDWGGLEGGEEGAGRRVEGGPGAVLHGLQRRGARRLGEAPGFQYRGRGRGGGMRVVLLLSKRSLITPLHFLRPSLFLPSAPLAPTLHYD